MKQTGFPIGTAIIATATIAFGVAGVAQAGTLMLNINTGTENGMLYAAVYDSQAAFDARKWIAGASSPANGGPAAMRFEGLEPGTYGIAVFLDKNGNDELDMNLFGAPTEPYGFSMNPEPGFGAPVFDAFRFDHDGNDRQLTIQLYGN